MPTNPTNSAGSLEINDSTVSQQFLTRLNDRMRRIALALPSATSTGSSGSSSSSGSTSGKQLFLCVPGTLAIQSNAAPAIELASTTAFSQIVMLLKQAPQGGSVVVQLYVAAAAWGPSVTLSSTSVTQSITAAAIPANAIIRLDITGVGLTFGGSDLTVILR